MVWISLLEHVALGMVPNACDEESLEIGSFGGQERGIVAPIIDYDDAKTGKLVLVGEPNLQRDCALDLAKRRPVVRRQAPTTQVRIEPNPPVIELEYSL